MATRASRHAGFQIATPIYFFTLVQPVPYPSLRRLGSLLRIICTEILHVLRRKGCNHRAHDRTFRVARLAIFRLEILELLGDILGMLSGQAGICGYNAIAVGIVTGRANLRCNLLTFRCITLDLSSLWRSFSENLIG